MKLWQFLSVILILSISPLEISGQNNSGIVSGSVFNSGQEPLVGVSVFVKGTNIGTMTDADGRFSVKAEDGQSLEFRYIGYDTKVVTVNGKTMSVTMSENQVILDDVVVIGYGTQKKSDLTGSLSSVKGEDIVKTGDTNITQSLHVQFWNSGGRSYDSYSWLWFYFNRFNPVVCRGRATYGREQCEYY